VPTENRETGEGREAGAGGPAADAPGGWMVAAVLCLVAAAVCWFLSYPSAAFVLAALGIVAWFLNVRAKLNQ
jgi:4-hydroxybenzoate polyprenyltransferase